MKAVLAFCTIVVATALAGGVNAQSGQNCAQIVSQINNVGATIDQNSTSYWAHRANFVDLVYGPSSQVVPNAMQLAEQEKSQAGAIKAGMPSLVASLKALSTAAQNGNAQGQNNNGQGQNNNGQGCLTPAQQSATVEPPIKQGKRVNFDQFPDELPESIVGPGPRQMPH